MNEKWNTVDCTSKIAPWPPHQIGLQQQNQAHLVSSAVRQGARIDIIIDKFGLQATVESLDQRSPSSSPLPALPALLGRGFASQVEGEQRDTWKNY